jgi:hypothetical protein
VACPLDKIGVAARPHDSEWILQQSLMQFGGCVRLNGAAALERERKRSVWSASCWLTTTASVMQSLVYLDQTEYYTLLWHIQICTISGWVPTSIHRRTVSYSYTFVDSKCRSAPLVLGAHIYTDVQHHIRTYYTQTYHARIIYEPIPFLNCAHILFKDDHQN